MLSAPTHNGAGLAVAHTGLRPMLRASESALLPSCLADWPCQPIRTTANAEKEDIAREAVRPTPRWTRRKALRMPVRLSARGRNAHGGVCFLQKALTWKAQAWPHTHNVAEPRVWRAAGGGGLRTGSLGSGASATPLWGRGAQPPRAGRFHPVRRARSCSAVPCQRAEGCRSHLRAAVALRRGALDARPALEHL